MTEILLIVLASIVLAFPLGLYLAQAERPEIGRAHV